MSSLSQLNLINSSGANNYDFLINSSNVMSLLTTGNVGIGITNPSSNDLLTLRTSISTNDTDIKFINSSTSNATIGIGGSKSTNINSSYQNNFFIHATCNIIFNTNNNTSPTIPNLFISTVGNIGIGTSTNLNDKLNINGNLNVNNVKSTLLNSSSISSLDTFFNINVNNLNIISLSSGKAQINYTGSNNTINYLYTSNYTNYQYISFINSGTFVVSGNSIVCDVLVVGGGGGGGSGSNAAGGGGGGGDVIYMTNVIFNPDTYNITVGLGGTGGIGGSITGTGNSGSNSAITSTNNNNFTNIFAGGGGGGGGVSNNGLGLNGILINNSSGGGGGGAVNGNIIGLGGSGNNYSGNGASGTYTINFAGGGGGGASSDAIIASVDGYGGNGGSGFQTDITGTLLGYGGGGGGYGGLLRGSGIDGGGNGSGSGTLARNSPRNNSGGGGGGGINILSGITGASGIVIIKFGISLINSSLPYTIINTNFYINNSNVGIGITNPSSNDLLTLRTSNSTLNTNINFINNANSNTIIGIGGTSAISLNSSYSNNFFIHATCNIILNANNNTSSNIPNLFISTSGNIGIGTSTNLINKLNINGNLSVTNINASGTITGNLSGTSTGLSGTPSIIVNNINASGTVGIGTTSVSSLFLNNGSITIFGNASNVGSTSSASFWYQTGIGPTISGANISFQTNGSTDVVRISSTGNCGIGLVNPATRLEVASGTASSASAQMYISYSTGPTVASNLFPTTDVCAIFNSSIWCKSRVTTSSDERIKTNIYDINDNSALQKILNIKPKTYNYIDNIERTSNLIYGFIAQQIKEIIPEAITLRNEIIPNIYSLCSNNNNIIYIPENILSNNQININDEINIIDGNNFKRDNYIITDINSNQIIIDKNLTGSNCFVYGTKVNDFHTLNKEYIFTLNVCATQDLYRIIQEQKELINNQQNQINNILTILNKNNIN